MGSCIDIDVRAQVFREPLLLASTPNGDSMESQVPRKLDTKMPQTTNALHSHQISAAQAGVPKSVVSRDACTEKRGGLRGIEFIWNRSDGAGLRDHHLRIPSVHCHSRHHWVQTIHHVAASTWLAHAVFACDQSDTNALTDLPSGHSGAQGFDAVNHFMPGHARQSQPRVYAHHRGRVGVTNPACVYATPDLPRSGLRDWPFDHAKNARLRDFHCFVRAFHLCVPYVAGKFACAHVANLVGCPPAILFASAIRSLDSEPRYV